MSKYNKGGIPTVGPTSVIQTTGEEVVNLAGGKGFVREPKAELLLLAASFMGGDDNFYEKESERFARLTALLNKEEVYSDTNWLYDFIGWVRNEANMRTVAMVIAVEAVLVRLSHELYGRPDIAPRDGGTVGNRDLVSVAMSRADEPAETLAYWNARHGGLMPQPIKNGIGDAAVRLYNEFSIIKYGNPTGAMVTAREVLRMTHPKPKDDKQAALFEYIAGDFKVTGMQLGMHNARKAFQSMTTDERIHLLRQSSGAPYSLTRILKQAGITWEALSEWSPMGMNGAAWDAIIPNMGVMALIRNLRNFDQAEGGISRESVRIVQAKLADADQIVKSRALPFRFYQAYRSVESVRWAEALENALDFSMSNIPVFDDETLVMVDHSGSMLESRVSKGSVVTYADAASLFGAAIKVRNPDHVDLFQYGSEWHSLAGGNSWGQQYLDHNGKPFSQYSTAERWNGVTKEIDAKRGASVLNVMKKFQNMGGTETHRAVDEAMKIGGKKYKRVILITDEQGWDAPNYDELPIPPNTNLYVWNLGGYQSGVSKYGRYHRHSFGGLNDNAFKMIPIIESGKKSGWPWQ